MIHRTRMDGPPSGGAAPGRELMQSGELWVEYTGTLPTAAEIDAHLHPVRVGPVTPESLFASLVAKGVLDETDRPKKQ